MVTLFLIGGVIYFITQSIFNALLVWEWNQKRRGEKKLIQAMMENTVVMYKKPREPKMDA